MSLQDYNNVTMRDIEWVIDFEYEQKLDEETRQELLDLCREKMKIKPSPFVHAANALNDRGYHKIVSEILIHASERVREREWHEKQGIAAMYLD